MLLWICIELIIASPPKVDAEVLAGRTVTGTLVRIAGQSVELETAEGRVSLQTDSLKELRVQQVTVGQEGGAEMEVQLADGSRTKAADFMLTGGRALIVLAGGQTVEVAAGDVVWVRLEAASKAVAAEWSKLVESPRHTDLLVVRREDTLDYHRGLLRGVNQTTVQFEIEGEQLPVRREKVFGLIFYQSPGRKLPESICQITLADGSRWSASALDADADQLRWATPLGATRGVGWGEVARVDFSQGKILYLSDLEPESVRWTPFVGLGSHHEVAASFFALRRDRSLADGPLRLGGKTYAKGIALHSRCEVTYRLPGEFRRFRALVGIDDQVRPQGHVGVTVRGDEKVLWEGTVTGDDPPQAVDVDIEGVRRLSILVDFGRRLDVADHLDLCEARVVK